jgi:hypothetical protein
MGVECRDVHARSAAQTRLLRRIHSLWRSTAAVSRVGISYARRSFHQVAPVVDSIEGLPPAVALQQQRGSPMMRSSVGSVTILSSLLRTSTRALATIPRNKACSTQSPFRRTRSKAHVQYVTALDHLGNARLRPLQGAPLRLVQALTIPSTVKGYFDHFGVDLKRNRLFATPEDSKAVLVFDLTQGKESCFSESTASSDRRPYGTARTQTVSM